MENVATVGWIIHWATANGDPCLKSGGSVFQCCESSVELGIWGTHSCYRECGRVLCRSVRNCATGHRKWYLLWMWRQSWDARKRLLGYLQGTFCRMAGQLPSSHSKQLYVSIQKRKGQWQLCCHRNLTSYHREKSSSCSNTSDKCALKELQNGLSS